MAQSRDIAYFQERERTERELAANSTNARVRDLHLQMAATYAAEAAALIRLSPTTLRVAS